MYKFTYTRITIHNLNFPHYSIL